METRANRWDRQVEPFSDLRIGESIREKPQYLGLVLRRQEMSVERFEHGRPHLLWERIADV
ncbi:MAG: hypothetical protein ACSLFM_10680, partial [Tepidiformaceae bacterium]